MNKRPAIETNTCRKTVLELSKSKHASQLTIDDILPILMSPDSGQVLKLNRATGVLTDGENSYPRRGNTQIMLPSRLHAFFDDSLSVPFANYSNDSFMQYFLLATIKQRGEINAPTDNIHYERHLHRMGALLQGAEGLVIDVGCDDPSIGASLFPDTVSYIGIDPFSSQDGPFRLVGFGEYLPFVDESCDGVLFNTSLDHILDWRHAIDEGKRVLRPGGQMYICTLVWTERAELINDSVHFHHFRESEIFSALDEMEIDVARRYAYKSDDHRHGLYVTARKTG